MKKLVYILFTVLFLSCGSEPTAEREEPAAANGNHVSLSDAQLKRAGIVTGNLEKKDISSVLRVTGKVDVPPQNLVSISVPLGGYLKDTKLLPGMHIRKGERIAVLEDPQYIELQQEYLTAAARLQFTEAEYARQKELNQSKAASDKVLQQITSDYKSQKVLVKALSEKLKLIGIDSGTLTEENLSKSISIPSPIDGYVSKVNVNVGKYVRPEDVLFQLVDPTDIHLNLNVFEKDINRLYIGQPLIAYTNNDPQTKYPCDIILISKDFSEDRSLEVHCHFKRFDQRLIPGLFMNAEINVQKNGLSVLPSDAVVNYENKTYVFISRGKNEFELTEVKTGFSEGGVTEVELLDQNIGTDQEFVIKGAYALLMAIKNVAE